MDTITHSISTQFMWGDGLLITPVVKEGAVNVWGYFPARTLPDPTRTTVWYELRTGSRIIGGSWENLDAPLDFIPLHVRGGAILPMQTHAQNTFLAYVYVYSTSRPHVQYFRTKLLIYNTYLVLTQLAEFSLHSVKNSSS